MIQYQCKSADDSDLLLRFYGDGKSTKVNVPLVTFPVGLTLLKSGMLTGIVASDSGALGVQAAIGKDGVSIDFTFSKAFTGFETTRLTMGE